LINALFLQIGATSLTDSEFSSLTITVVSLDVLTYEALLAVLTARESVSDSRDRLRYYYLARGVSIPTEPAGKTNIFIGGEVC
jgi:hypothetical protein